MLWVKSRAHVDFKYVIKLLLKVLPSWRDGSEGKSIDCFFEGPEFKSHQPHGGSQPSVMGSDVLFWCLKTDTVYSYK